MVEPFTGWGSAEIRSVRLNCFKSVIVCTGTPEGIGAIAPLPSGTIACETKRIESLLLVGDEGWM